MLLIRAYAYELVVCIHARTYASYRDMHIMNTMHTSSYSTSCRQHGTRVHVYNIFYSLESIMYAYYELVFILHVVYANTASLLSISIKIM